MLRALLILWWSPLLIAICLHGASSRSAIESAASSRNSFAASSERLAPYALMGLTTNNGAVLRSGRRLSPSTFVFQFYAPVATNYTVERTFSLSAPDWQTVITLFAGPSNFVAVADQAATSAIVFYRVRY